MANIRKNINIDNKDLWYLVGLITSDGCLSKDGRHIDITSKDHQFLKELKDRLNLTNKIGIKNRGMHNQAYKIQISNRNFYDFLLSIGLMPNKSLILGALTIPSPFFADFLRGLVDGDGCIRNWIHSSNKKEQWSLRIYSGSVDFIEWLKNTIESLLKVKGRIHSEKENKWILKYGKMATREIAKKCYYKDCFGLQRKMVIAQNCMGSSVGWNKSRTVNF